MALAVPVGPTRATCGGPHPVVEFLDHPPLATWVDRVGRPDSACGWCRSAADAVADVGGLRGVDDADDVQGDERGQQVEESAAGTEEHWDVVDLHLVEHPCLDGALRDVSAAYLDVAVPGSGLRLCHGAFDAVGHVGHQRVVPPGGRAGRPVTGYEDRGTVVVTAPVIHELGGPPPCEDGTGGVPLGFELSGRPAGSEPVVEQFAVIPA